MELPDSYRLNPDLNMITARIRNTNAPALICSRLVHEKERTNSAGTLPTNAAGMIVSKMNFVAVLNKALGYSENVNNALKATWLKATVFPIQNESDWMMVRNEMKMQTPAKTPRT